MEKKITSDLFNLNKRLESLQTKSPNEWVTYFAAFAALCSAMAAGLLARQARQSHLQQIRPYLEIPLWGHQKRDVLSDTIIIHRIRNVGKGTAEILNFIFHKPSEPGVQGGIFIDSYAWPLHLLPGEDSELNVQGYVQYPEKVKRPFFISLKVLYCDIERNQYGSTFLLAVWPFEGFDTSVSHQKIPIIGMPARLEDIALFVYPPQTQFRAAWKVDLLKWRNNAKQKIKSLFK